MKLRLFRMPFPARLIYPGALFRLDSKVNELCLTFDDGPCPSSTFKVLEILERHNVKAVFFCNGEQAKNNRELISDILSQGHFIGNHGYYHLDGFRTPVRDYMLNAGKADEYTSGTIFRPPYGRITPAQYRELKKKYRICFWDVMPYDFDSRLNSAESLSILSRYTRNGSVIALHDTKHSHAPNFLDQYLGTMAERGFRFVDIPFLEKVT